MNKRKSRFFRRAIMCTLALSMSLAAVGCGETETNGKITVIVRSSGAEYWDFCKQGADEAGNELRYEVTFEAPQTEAEDNVQVDMIRQAVKDKVDALVISPLDTNAVADALNEVQQAGIDIIMINNEANSTFDTKGRKICIATNTPASGHVAARQAYELMNGRGKIAVIAHTSDESVDNGRFNGFNEEIESDNKIADDGTKGKYAEMEIVNIDYCNADTETAYQQTLNILNEIPDIKLIYATNENASVGACQAVKEKELSDKVSVIGFDSSSTQVSYLMEDVLDGMIVQNPYNMGYLGVRYAHQVINGSEVPDIIDTGVTYVDRNNYDSDGVQLVIDPVTYSQKKNSGNVTAANSEEAN